MSDKPIENNEINQRLSHIEQQIDRLAAQPAIGFGGTPNYRDDEIDLREIWNILWDGKWWIMGITALFAVASVFYALSLPNQYKAEVVLAPAQEQSGGMGGLAAQYGGLAAMAGINLGRGQSSDVDQAIVLIRSWPFLDAFVEKYDLKPQVMAVRDWDRTNDRILYDKDIYDPETQQWVREPKLDRPAEPTSYEVYDAFSKMLAVNHDSKTGLIRLSVEHYVPRLAYEWAGLLTLELNRHFQARDIRDANRNIEYLTAKINETSIAEMQLVFYRMIESQMKTLMLAEVSGEYLVKQVVKPKIPELQSSPNRKLIVILSTLAGVVLSIVAFFMLNLIRRIARPCHI